jgi:hypothetical protein
VLDRLYGFIARHRQSVLAGYLFATVAAVWLCAGLSLDSDVVNLLPPDLPAVKSARKLQRWAGDLGFMYLGLVRDDRTSVKDLQRFADALGAEIEKSRLVKKPVSVSIDVSSIKRGLALALDPDDLETIGARLEQAVKAERRKKSGFFMDLEEPAPAAPGALFEDLAPKYRKRLQWKADAQAATGVDPSGGALARLRARASNDGTRLYYLSTDGQMMTFVFHPTFPSDDLTEYPALVADVDRAVATAKALVPTAAPITVLKGGAYPLQYDQRDSTLRDSLRASAWSALLILLITSVTLRRPTVIGLVFASLLVGLALTFGVARLLVGSVNVITAFMLAILAGLGIDFGLYLATRVALLGKLRSDTGRKTGATEADVREGWRQTVVPAAMGALTTMAVMALLTRGAFRGFAELGLICGVGIVATFAVMYTLLPALLLTFVVKRTEADARPPSAANAPNPEALLPPPSAWSPAGRGARWVLGAGLGLTVAAALLATRVRFAYTGEELTVKNQASLQIDREIIKHFGENPDVTVTLADTEERGRRVHAHFQERFGTWKSIARYESAFTYAPPVADQKRALERLEPLVRALEKLPQKQDDPDLAWAFAVAREAIKNPEIVTLDRLPAHIQDLYLGRDAAGKITGYIGHMRASHWLWEVEHLTAFVNEVEALAVDGVPIETTGRPQVFMRVIQLVQREATIFSFAGAALILGMFWLQMRKLSLALLAMFPLGIGIVWTLGCLPFVGSKGLSLSFMNLVVLPILVGLGVSYGVQVVYAFRIYGSASRALQVTVRAILGSAACTLVGWASLIPASMIGMQGIGWLATLGMLAVTACSLLLLPALLAVLHARGWVRA